MPAIPNPLRSGEYALAGGNYAGDVGSTDSANPAVLDLSASAVATVTVEGLGDPFGQSGSPHYAKFSVSGSDTLDLTAIGGGRSPYGPGYVQVDLAAGASLAGSFKTDIDGFLTINGAQGAALSNFSGTSGGGTVTLNADLTSGTITMNAGYPSFGGKVEVNGAVGSGETINVNAGQLLLDKPMQFQGAIIWQSGVDPGEQVTFKGTTASSYSYDGMTLHLYSGDSDVLDTRVAFAAGSSPSVEQTASGVAISANQSYDPTAAALPEHVAPTSQSDPGANYAVYDVSNSQTSIVSGETYTGGVDYLKSQLITQTPDNVNVAPIIDNTFVHTGSGDDAISFAGHSGRNVADGGTGSNFLTSGNGNDTFFDDARGASKDIWNTIVNFHAGDAATLWGVTSKDFVFNWVGSEGAAGAQGLTLHAVSKTGGPTISVSFAGHGMSDMGSLAISENTSSNYTYLLQT